MGEVKVLGAFESFFAYRVEWALIRKGIKYEYIEEDLKNKSPLLLKCNPVHKKVPVLLHGKNPIAESLVILEYIDDTWKENPLLPQDPLERAKARFWAKFADEKCLSSIRTACRSEGKDREKALEESLEALKILEEELKGKEFFGGESIGFVDLVVAWIPHWLPLLEEVFGFKLLDANTFPSLHSWGDRFLNVPFIKEKLPPSDKLLVIYTNKEKALGESLEALKTMEEELKGREFFGGESLRFVELVVGWTPHWVPVFEEVAEFNILDANAFPSPCME